MRLRSRGCCAAGGGEAGSRSSSSSSSSRGQEAAEGGGGGDEPGPPLRSPFVHQLRFSALQKAKFQVDSHVGLELKSKIQVQ